MSISRSNKERETFGWILQFGSSSLSWIIKLFRVILLNHLQKTIKNGNYLPEYCRHRTGTGWGPPWFPSRPIPWSPCQSLHLPAIPLSSFCPSFLNHFANLVDEDADILLGNADLLGEQQVLPGLGHRSVRRCDHENGPFHLSRSSDHVL